MQAKMLVVFVDTLKHCHSELSRCARIVAVSTRLEPVDLSILAYFGCTNREKAVLKERGLRPKRFDKTQQSELKVRYQQAPDNAAQKLLEHPITQTMVAAERQIWIDWARWMVNNYQRTSSAVKGRNGYLTRLHHSGRGFCKQTLQVLTIIHNFHLKRPDDTTAAQRLFDYEFPDLFDWVVDHIGALPLARQSQKVHRTNPFHLEGFPP
jgi:hypothetical protein